MRVVRFVWRLLVAVKDGLVLLAMLLFFGGLYAALSVRPAPVVPGSGALTIAFDGGLVEQPAEVDPFDFVSPAAVPTRDVRLRDMVRALDAAARAGSIRAVVLDLDRFTGASQATIAEAGVALDRVRRAGKPVLAYATGYTDDGYQLAAHASEVWLDPLGAVLVAGPGGAQLYYKGLLDKLGVTTHVYRVGTYKSAVEPFILREASPAARAAAQALADSLWASWRAEVAAARPAARIDPYVAGLGAPVAGPATFAERARAAGLVDRIGDRIAFGERVAALAGRGRSEAAGDYARIRLDAWAGANPERAEGRVGVLTIAGDIVDGRAALGRAGGDTIATLLLDELARNRIRALVVRIDSPGGSVTASERIRAAIAAAKAKGLPVVASMGGVAASGGYYAATAADRILAQPSTITGSIGVFGLLPTFAGSLEKIGLSADGVATTPLSGQPDLYRGTSAQFDALMQRGVEDFYRRFVGLVAAARRMPAARVDGIAQGRVWPGDAARRLGLVDGYGTLGDAVAEAARLARLDPKTAGVRYIEREPDAWKAFARDLFDRRDRDADAPDAFTRLARRPDALLAQAVAEARMLAAGPAMQMRCLECGAAGGAVRTGVPGAGWAALLGRLP
ncbi:MAG: signal peptide peptidase SppA [Sphingomonas fennica]